MSNQIEVKAYPVRIEEHPSADRLELAFVGDFSSIVLKDKHKTGERVLFIPAMAVLPEPVLRGCGLWDEEAGTGVLSGKDKNRVKPMRLRSVLSEGIVASFDDVGVEESDDPDHNYAHELSITKYTPRIPESFSGQVFAAVDSPRMWDTPNMKHPEYVDIFSEGELVQITEKIHGTCLIAHFEPEVYGEPNSVVFTISSKGQSQGMKALVESDANVYWNAARKFYVESISGYISTVAQNYVKRNCEGYDVGEHPTVSIFGEVFGPGIQGGFAYAQEEKKLAIFSVVLNKGKSNEFDFSEVLSSVLLREASSVLGIPVEETPITVPLLYSGPWSPDLLDKHLAGNSVVSKMFDLNAGPGNIREGVVIKSLEVPPGDRPKFVKMHSPDFLTRGGEVTEYE